MGIILLLGLSFITVAHPVGWIEDYQMSSMMGGYHMNSMMHGSSEMMEDGKNWEEHEEDCEEMMETYCH